MIEKHSNSDSVISSSFLKLSSTPKDSASSFKEFETEVMSVLETLVWIESTVASRSSRDLIL